MKIIWPRSTNECPNCNTALVNLKAQDGYFGGVCPNCRTIVVWPVDWWQSQMSLSRGVDSEAVKQDQEAIKRVFEREPIKVTVKHAVG